MHVLSSTVCILASRSMCCAYYALHTRRKKWAVSFSFSPGWHKHKFVSRSISTLPPDRQSIVYGDIVTMLSFAANATRRSSSIHASITQTVGETPIVKLQRMAPEGINVFVKCESENPGGSVKDRLALGVIEWAEKEGHLKPGQTVVEASSGNTGIGLAMVCAARGYPLVVVMSESFSIERRKLMRFLGAKVVLTNPGEL